MTVRAPRKALSELACCGQSCMEILEHVGPYPFSVHARPLVGAHSCRRTGALPWGFAVVTVCCAVCNDITT